MSDKPAQITKKIFCNTCKIDTKHEVKAVHTRVEKIYDEDIGEPPFAPVVYWEQWEYKLLTCRGCDTAMLEETYTDAGMYDSDSGNQIEITTIYPQRNYRVHSPKRFRNLDEKLETLYQEVIIGFNAGVKIGCSMSLRALLEGICVNKGITDAIAWGLEEKLKKLEDGNHLPSNIVDCLLSFKFIGDNAAHKLEAPSKDELELAISVMEDLLNFLFEAEYELTIKAKKLAKFRESDIAKLKNKPAKNSIAKKEDTAKG
jgi:hypothetical protein